MADAVIDGADGFERRVVVASDAVALADAAAGHLRRALAEAITARGACWIALAGGRTPRAVYERLAVAGTPAVDWTRVHVAFGDERLVPPEHADSNYAMVRTALFDRVAIPPAQIHRIEGERGASADAADAYAATVSAAFALEPGAWPVFDVVLLGVGPDGHTASLFPHTAALDVGDRLAAAAQAPAAPTDRITLTYPVLNAARAVVLLVSGEDKADAVARAFDDTVPTAACPVRGVRPNAGSVTWHLDAAAASKLSTDLEDVTPT
ncbi:MAG: 6-phosphogluconolactonase [Vicinamibacteraceae bacterium]